MATTTIFERAGGFATVRRVISSFYDRVLDSPTVAGHFENVDMRRLIDHQTKFISAMMGGPGSFTDDHLRRVHAHLGITHDEFVEVTEHLREALEEYGVAPEDIAIVEAEVKRREPLIVTHG